MAKPIKRTKPTGFTQAAARVGGNQKVEDLVDVVKPGVEYEKFRFLEVVQRRVIWVDKRVKDRQTKKKKDISFPIFPADDETANELSRHYGDKARDTLETYANVIVRTEKTAKAKTTYMGEWLEKGDASPVKVMRIPPGAVGKLKDLQRDFNKGIDLVDESKGCDVKISFDKSRSPADMWRFTAGKRTPLNDAEKQYAMWNLDALCNTTPRSEIAKRLVEEGYDGPLLDDAPKSGKATGKEKPVKPSKKPKAPKTSKKSKKGKPLGKVGNKAKAAKKAKDDYDEDEDIPF